MLALALAAWELVTAKLDWLPRPFFAAPQSILEVFTDDYARLGESVWRSVLLVAPGYALGAAAGFPFGVAMGWSRVVGYWAHPVVRLIGPLPATAWLPIAFFAFPTSLSASTFLMALATLLAGDRADLVGCPGVTKPTTTSPAPWAPSAIPRPQGRDACRHAARLRRSVHGPGRVVRVLVVAEMLGVKAGLGWYMQWAQGWAAYANMYAALLVMALMCSGLP